MKEAILRSTITECKPCTYLRSISRGIPEYNTHPAHTALTMGICDSINHLIEEMMQSHPIKIVFKCFEISEVDLTDKVKAGIFSLVKEHLHTIVKHEKVWEINIGLSQNKNRIMLSIADDIMCFDTTSRTSSNMINVKHLPGIHSGNLNLISNPYIGNCLIYHQNIY